MSRYFRLGRSKTGLGMFATRPIKRGAYIATYRGRVISDEEAERREARGARYMFELTKKKTIDGSPRWNIARYINHSCKPNAKPVGRKGGIVIVADRRIAPEEEITYDYGGCKCDACRKKRARKRRKQRQAAAARKPRGGAKRKARPRASAT
jgi:SET domain-containing protein